MNQHKYTQEETEDILNCIGAVAESMHITLSRMRPAQFVAEDYEIILGVLDDLLLKHNHDDDPAIKEARRAQGYGA